jgi:hypothetical protein
MVDVAGLRGPLSNPGPVAATAALDRYVRQAVGEAEKAMDQVFRASADNAAGRVEDWSNRVDQWESAADDAAQRLDLTQRRLSVDEERRLAQGMAPDRQLVRPLVLVMPADHPTAATVGE